MTVFERFIANGAIVENKQSAKNCKTVNVEIKDKLS